MDDGESISVLDSEISEKSYLPPNVDPVQKGFGGKSGASGPLVMVSSHFILNSGGIFFPVIQ